MNPSIVAALVSGALLVPAPANEMPGEEVPIYAFISADSLEVGGEYVIEVFVELPEDAKTSASGAPAPFLQIDVPASIELGGKYLTTFKDLSDNEFLQEPYERLLTKNPAQIPFKLLAKPAPGETIGLNILAYVKPGGGARDYFMRRRFELPIEPGIEAVEVASENSRWGNDRVALQIGDKAVGFELPRADGSLVNLDEHLGKKNIIVTTYRAFW